MLGLVYKSYDRSMQRAFEKAWHEFYIVLPVTAKCPLVGQVFKHLLGPMLIDNILSFSIFESASARLSTDLA